MIEKLENRAWKVLKSENILNLGPWLNVRQELVELPSGKQIPTWFVLDFPDWINVIAITKDGDFVMEDQYRHGLLTVLPQVEILRLQLIHHVFDARCVNEHRAQHRLLRLSGMGHSPQQQLVHLASLPCFLSKSSDFSPVTFTCPQSREH